MGKPTEVLTITPFTYAKKMSYTGTASRNEKNRRQIMTFTYPAVITPHKDDDGFHIVFPDLELCEGDGPEFRGCSG